MNDSPRSQISSLRVRLVVYAVMVVLAVAAICVIDRRAMSRMAEPDAAPPARPRPTPNLTPRSTRDNWTDPIFGGRRTNGVDRAQG